MGAKSMLVIGHVPFSTWSTNRIVDLDGSARQPCAGMKEPTRWSVGTAYSATRIVRRPNKIASIE
jgi:hypothetical protein